MNLYVVRHGIAINRDDPKCPAEAERFLTEEGLKKTTQVAKGVAALAPSADSFVSSPYVRAMQTAEIFAEALGYSKTKIRQTDALLPGADPLPVFRELAREKQAASVFLFGHVPQLDEVIAYALSSKHTVTDLKKAGVAVLELSRVSPPTGKLVWLATPRLLRHSRK